MRIPSLDGLRAISIGLVLMSHGLASTAISGRPWFFLINRGDLGVSIFFVISGFLITALLLREEEKTGAISLKDFYLRRFFRIVPPFYVFLLAVLMVWHVGWITSDWRSWFGALFFVRDYVPHGDWWTGHSWSLSIEEQFYLLWPFALAMLGRKRGLKLALLIIVFAPPIRILSHRFWNHGPFDFYMFHNRMDGLMIGCALALVQSVKWFQDAWQEVCRPWLALVCVAFLFVASPLLTHRFAGWYSFPFGLSLDNFAIAYLMLYVIRNEHSLVGRALNWKPAVHIGALSYSLYLWQQLFLSENTHWHLLALCAAFLCAEVSFFFVEKPSRWMRDRVYGQSAIAPSVVLMS